jgi:GGDEF domain-containing protein
MNAVRREDARHVRYGRPVSVVLLELTRDATGLALDAIASDVADVICGQARSTDRAVRLTAGSFRILMPETGEDAAKAAAGRLERTYGSTPSGDNGEILRIEVATCSRSRSLIEALEDAEERLGIVDLRRMSSSA